MGSDTDARYDNSLPPAEIIVELCAQLYHQGGCTGTAGGMSIRDGTNIWLAPSGVQKERMRASEIFKYNSSTQTYVTPPANLKPSACMPLFLVCHQERNAGACIHTHSQAAVLVTMLFDSEFRISNIEQIKAIPRVTTPGNLSNTDTLAIPIIDNAPHEEDLEESLRSALRQNPSAAAVLVRRHGLFVWARDVWKAKVMHEALDYLFELAIKMHHLGIPTTTPHHSIESSL